MDECHPSLSYCLPRRSRWERPYACIAVAKGLITPALTGWAAICQQFSPFLLKRVPFGGSNRSKARGLRANVDDVTRTSKNTNKDAHEYKGPFHVSLSSPLWGNRHPASHAAVCRLCRLPQPPR